MTPDEDVLRPRCAKKSTLWTATARPGVRSRRRLALAAAFAGACLAPAAACGQDRRVGRVADEVMLRGAESLEDALRLAVGGAVRHDDALPVSLVVDVTPYVRRSGVDLERALVAVGARLPAVPAWRVAALGEPFSPAAPGAAALVDPLRRVLARPDRPVPNTCRALLASLDGLDEPGIVAYLADWRFEDDDDLEAVVDRLRKRRQSLYVVGSEACFGRAWLDGFYPPDRGSGSGADVKWYDHDVGRDPFGPRDPAAPWHGGDVAAPHLPFHWHGAWWSTKFPVDLPPPPVVRPRYGAGGGAGGPGALEDVRERIDAVDADALERYWFPLPSSFGPYGLMRAAAESGGRYVLWSWNRAGRTGLRYDYARCDAFAPDLRPRATILDDVARRPAAIAAARAWHAVSNRRTCVADVTPPVADDLRTPRVMTETRGEGFLSYGWADPAAHRGLLRAAPATLEALDAALAILDAAAKRAPRDAVDRRLYADVDLFRHTLLIHRFTVGEAWRAARDEVPADAWSDPGLQPGLDPVRCLDGGPDPADVALRPDAPVRDAALLRRVQADRARMLARYAGTPFAELVSRNCVYTVRFRKTPYGAGKPAREAPASSKGPRGATGTGSSGGSGGATGR